MSFERGCVLLLAGTLFHTTGVTGEGTTTGGEATAGGLSTTTGDPPAEPYYLAYMYIGGYDRLIIQKADPVAGRCTSIAIVHLHDMVTPGVEISTPLDWSIERITIEPDLQYCKVGNTLPNSEIQSMSAVGTVSWTDDMWGWPALVDIDVTLTFVQDEPWKPAEEVLFAVDLPVDP